MNAGKERYLSLLRMLQREIIDRGLLVAFLSALWREPAWQQREAMNRPAGATSLEPLETAVPEAWMVESHAQASWI